MSNYSYSTFCPRCREHGGDTRGDNLAVYADGSAWCFACHYYIKPLTYNTTQPKQWYPLNLEPLPDKFHEYLDKFELTEEERSYFKYNNHNDRMVFQVPGFWEARSLNRNPKYISKGSKKFIPFGTGDPLVLVEDVISAIKVARVTRAAPLWGSNLPPDFFEHLLNFPTVIVWLDRDKFKESLAIANRIQQIAFCRVISTEKDPKLLSTIDIQTLVKSPPKPVFRGG